MQTSPAYTVLPGLWFSLSGSYFFGGRTPVDGVKNSDEQEGRRLRLRISMPVNRHDSVKIRVLRGFNAHREPDLDVIGIMWQYRWRGGLGSEMRAPSFFRTPTQTFSHAHSQTHDPDLITSEPPPAFLRAHFVMVGGRGMCRLGLWRVAL